jgi:hypothetical protein
MIVKELKFIGLLLFIIFAFLILIGIIFLITFQRFKCSEYVNYIKKIPISGKINEIIPFLQTGDLIFPSDCLNNNMNNLDCYRLSRINFIKNSYNYNHISMIYRKNDKIYLIENISNDHFCSNKKSLVNPKYNGGLRIVNFEEYIKQIKESSKKNKSCCRKYGIRFINRKLNQNKLNRRLENEFNILSDTNFNSLPKLQFIAASGWLLKDMPNNYIYSTEIFYPNDKKDTFFCSETIGVLLQRIGVMKRVNRSRMYYPSDYNGINDNNMFEKGMYSTIQIYE